MREEAFRKFKENLPFSFKQEALLEAVFVHSSYLNEKDGANLQSNERLEFLGDAALSSCISHILYERFPDEDEGELTNMKSRLVNRGLLAKVAIDMDMGRLMLLGKGESKGGGARNPAILSNAFEALIAAVYLDGGYNALYSFVENIFAPYIAAVKEEVSPFDFKSILQEITQRHFKTIPLYRVVKEEGPSHKKIFTVEVIAAGEILGSAASDRKKSAEQASAEHAIENLKKKGYSLDG